MRKGLRITVRTVAFAGLLLVVACFSQEALAAHFPEPASNTNRSADYIVHFRITGEAAATGDEIAFFNPRNVVCGRYVVAAPSADTLYPVAVYGDEEAAGGETLTVKVWDASRSLEMTGNTLVLTPGPSNEYYQASAIPPVWQDQTGYVLRVDTATHFTSPAGSPLVCNFIGSLVIDDHPAATGDEVAAFDQDGVLCGFARVETGGKFNIAIYGDDSVDDAVDEGAVDGEILSFKVWYQKNGVESAGANIVLSDGGTMGSEFYLPSPIPPIWTNFQGYTLNIHATSTTGDTTPPTVTATPAGGAYQAPHMVALAGSEPATIYYTVDGTEPTSESMVYTTPVSIRKTTDLKFIAIDEAGNWSETRTESYILSIPLRIYRGGSGSGAIQVNRVVVSWQDNEAEIIFDETMQAAIEAFPDPYSSFIGWMGACFGSSNPCRTTIDQAKSVTALFKDVDRPTGSISYAGGPYTTSPDITLDLTVPDVNEIAAMKFSSDGRSKWSSEEPFSTTRAWHLGTSDGLKAVYVMFLDHAENWSDSYHCNITLDRTPPGILLPDIPDGMYANQTPLVISGTVVDVASGVKTLSINGTPLAIDNGRFTRTLALQEGENLVQIVSDDFAGNVKTDSRTIILDTQPPAISLTASPEGFLTNQPLITLTGTTDDAVKATLKTNDGAYSILTLEDQAFSKQIALVGGLNVVEVTAFDRAGNVGTATLNIVYIQKGDINADGALTLADATLALRALIGVSISATRQADVNHDNQIGMEEALYILQTLSGMR